MLAASAWPRAGSTRVALVALGCSAMAASLCPRRATRGWLLLDVVLPAAAEAAPCAELLLPAVECQLLELMAARLMACMACAAL